MPKPPDLAAFAAAVQQARDKLDKARADMIAVHQRVDQAQRDYDLARAALMDAVAEATKGTP